MNTKSILQVSALSAVLVTTTLLGGCAATQVAISKRKLDVQTKMSRSIFLDPVSPANQTIYLQVRNTTDKSDFNIRPQLAERLRAKGYRIVRNLKNAHYMLQVEVLRVSQVAPSAAEKALNGGYGSMIGAAGFGVGAAALAGAGGRGLLGAGLLGAAVSTVADAAVKDVMYTGITDVRVSVRAKHKWVRHTTRIMSTAEKVNLKFALAKPYLEAGLAKSISGIF